MIHGLHHCAIATRDIDRLCRFYCELFGFEKVAEGSWADLPALDVVIGLPNTASRFAMLSAGNALLELFEFSSPKPGNGDPERRACDPGFTHLCMNVTDIDSEYERLRAAGMRFHARPWHSAALCFTYGRDPDGNIVELLEVPDEKSPYRLQRIQNARMR